LQKPAFAFIILFLLTLLGCGSSGGGSSHTSPLTAEEAAYLENIKIDDEDLPDFKSQQGNSYLQRYNTNRGEIKFYLTTENWKSNDKELTVTYSLYDSESLAENILNSSVKNNPANLKPNTINGKPFWEAKVNDNWQIYVLKGKTIVFLRGEDRDLLHRACKVVMDREAK